MTFTLSSSNTVNSNPPCRKLRITHSWQQLHSGGWGYWPHTSHHDLTTNNSYHKYKNVLNWNKVELLTRITPQQMILTTCLQWIFPLPHKCYLHYPGKDWLTFFSHELCQHPLTFLHLVRSLKDVTDWGNAHSFNSPVSIRWSDMSLQWWTTILQRNSSPKASICFCIPLFSVHVSNNVPKTGTSDLNYPNLCLYVQVYQLSS